MVTIYTGQGKGVICKVVPWQQMPRDKNGVYADVITDAASVIARMNIGRMYEHQITGAARDVTARLRNIIGSEKTTHDKLMKMDDTVISELWRQLLEINSCINGDQYRAYLSLTDKSDKCEVLVDSINTNIKLLLPIDHNKSIKQISIDIENVVKPTFDKVTFNDFETGEEMVSERKVRIGHSYFILLNKIADDGSSVAIAKQQHYGVLTSSTKHDKYSNAWRNTPVRTDGESEVRIKVGYAGEELQAETMDMSNSSMTQRELYNNILIADKPSNIPRIIDREKFPLGTSRPIQNIKHSLMVAGLRIESVPDNDVYHVPSVH